VFVTIRGLKGRLGLSHYAATKLVGEDGFPAPVLVVGGDDRVWSWHHVEAHLAGRPLPAAPALVEKLIEADVLSEKLALRRGTTFQSRTTLPPPWGQLGSQQIWHADQVDEWIAALPERDRARINRRRAKRGLAPL
jgi:hypothetical protein